MLRPYRIIIIEDLPSDSALIRRELKKAIGSCDFLVMDNKEEFVEGLFTFQPDIILSDYSIPGFDWLTAYQLTRQHWFLVPFFIVSGSTNPEIAAECIRNGANGFISKDNLTDLRSVILDALNPIG
jgi:CheY-like chemotaxis protein